jgi:hypothetical protein
MKQIDKPGSSFLLNARGSLVRLTRDEIVQVGGGYDNESSSIRDENDLGCNSYTNQSGCDWNWTHDW